MASRVHEEVDSHAAVSEDTAAAVCAHGVEGTSNVSRMGTGPTITELTGVP